ncbi:MAG TPA: hypothetical protein VIX86_07300 [Streptosporangiaceae bacterium]
MNGWRPIRVTSWAAASAAGLLLLTAPAMAGASPRPAGGPPRISGVGKTLVARWSGTSWKAVSAPSPGGSGISRLYGVTATSSGNAWAVGEYNPGVEYKSLVEHWNGTKWAQQTSPDPSSSDNFLAGVAATSSGNAWAAGFYYTGTAYDSFIVHWNGTKWSKQTSPDPSSSANSLSAVAVTSSTNAWAVGYYHHGSADQTLILHWNGTKWAQQTSTDPGGSSHNNYLTGVTAVSASNAWAVGEYSNGTADRTLIEHWNGTKWSTETSPDAGGATDSNDLYAVAASSGSNAWAAGDYHTGGADQTLILRWNGTKWATVTSPDPGGASANNDLYGVTAGSASTTWAVGDYFNGSKTVTLIEQWSGSTWSAVSSPNGSGSSDSELFGVAVTSGTNAWAAGWS